MQTSAQAVTDIAILVTLRFVVRAILLAIPTATWEFWSTKRQRGGCDDI